ncbi:MAG: hypothetical protein WA478_12120 [Pseudolabrys sp.]
MPILSVCLLVTQNGQRVGVELHKLQSAKPCKNSVSGRALKKRAIAKKAAIPGVRPGEGYFDLGQRLLSQINDYPRDKKISS